VIGIEETGQEADQRRFAAAILADQSDGFAELDAQVKLHQSLGALEAAVQHPLEDAATLPPALFNPLQKPALPEPPKETKP